MSEQTNAADEKQIKGNEDRVARIERQRIDDLKDILSSRIGRRFYWDLMAYCGVFKTSMSSSNSQVLFNEGRRVVGLKLLKDMEIADPEAYLKMVNEDREDREREVK